MSKVEGGEITADTDRVSPTVLHKVLAWCLSLC